MIIVFLEVMLAHNLVGFVLNVFSSFLCRRLWCGYLSFDFGSFRVFLALICAICGPFTPKVEVSGKEGKILRPAPTVDLSKIALARKGKLF